MLTTQQELQFELCLGDNRHKVKTAQVEQWPGSEREPVRIEDLGMQATPFHARGQPIVFAHYQAQQAADKFLQRVLEDNRGIGLLSGIESSGKTTIVSHFVRNLPADIPVAVVDATGIVASELLATILTQFGFKGPIQLTDDLLNLLKKFVVQGHTVKPGTVACIGKYQQFGSDRAARSLRASHTDQSSTIRVAVHSSEQTCLLPHH